MVSHDNFLRDPRNAFDISSTTSSPLVSPSYSTDSTNSRYSNISEDSSVESSSFTFPTIQEISSSSLTLSTNSNFTTYRKNFDQDVIEEEETDQFSIFPLCPPNKFGGSGNFQNIQKPTMRRASDTYSHSEVFDEEQTDAKNQAGLDKKEISSAHQSIDIEEPLSLQCEACTRAEMTSSPSKLRDMFARSGLRRSRNRIVSSGSSGLRSRLSSLTQSNDSSSMEEGSACSTTSTDKSNLKSPKPKYWIMVLGSKGSGKTSIIQQFLYDKFDTSYEPTSLEQMYYGEFDIHGRTIGFDIQDVSGSYVDEFPPMRKVSFEKADAFILTFALNSYQSWQEVERLRDMIHSEKGENVPIVIVGNKSDLKATRDTRIPQENALDASISLDWENGFVQSSAKDRHNINKIFKELLQQSKTLYHFDTPSSTSSSHGSCAQGSSPLNTPVKLTSQPAGFDWMKTKSRPPVTKNGIEDCLKRRVSLPAMCPTNTLTTLQNTTNDSLRLKDNEVGKPHLLGKKKISCTKSQFPSSHDNVLSQNPLTTQGNFQTSESRRLSLAVTSRKDSCRIS